MASYMFKVWTPGQYTDQVFYKYVTTLEQFRLLEQEYKERDYVYIITKYED